MNFRTAKWRVDIAMCCDVEYSGNALGYQTWNIRFEGKLTFLQCSASFYAIPFNFSPLAKLCFTLLDCIIHQLWGAWFCIYSNANHWCQPLCFHVTLCRTQLLMFFLWDVFFFPPKDRISCLVKRGNEK